MTSSAHLSTQGLVVRNVLWGGGVREGCYLVKHAGHCLDCGLGQAMSGPGISV